jgi:hypothetical protein
MKPNYQHMWLLFCLYAWGIFRVQVLVSEMFKVLDKGWCMGWNYNPTCDWFYN